MATYYIPEGTPIATNTWQEVQEYSKEGEPLERLDAEQMYHIADLAPAWDCFEPDYYAKMCDLVGLNSGDYESCDDLMAAVAVKLGLEAHP